MPRHHGKGTLRSIGMQAADATLRTGSNAIASTFKYMATDHTGMSGAMMRMPDMGFMDSMMCILRHFLLSVAGAILSGIWVFLLIAYGIPFLITGEF